MTTMVLSENFPPTVGGSARWLWELYRRWPQGQVVVAAGEHPQQTAFDTDAPMPITRMPLRFKSWGMTRPTEALRYLRAARTVDRVARQHNVHEIHCCRCLPEGLIAHAIRQWRGLPYRCYVHGEELNSMAASRELTWLGQRVYRNAQTLIVNSHNTARLLREQFGIEHPRACVVHPGVDTEHFRPAVDRKACRSELAWRGQKVVLTVGRLQRRKGHDRMIEALPTIRAAIPNVRYAIVGDGEERSRLEARAKKLGVSDHVQFLGGMDDAQLLRAYQGCDVFALPNRDVEGDTEGFGMVLLEAQACGVPVITGITGGTGETISNGRTGLMIDCNEIRAISHAAVLLLSNAPFRRHMGAAARQWAMQRLDWHVTVGRAMHLLGVAPREAVGMRRQAA